MSNINLECKFFWRVILSSLHRFYWDNGFSKAAALAYTTLFSLVPITVVALAILGSSILANKTVAVEVRNFVVEEFLPGLDQDLQNQVEVKLEEFGGKIVDLLSFSEETYTKSFLVFIFLFVSSLLLINSIESQMNQIWQVYEPRSLAHRLSVFCTIIVLAPVFALAAYYANRILTTTAEQSTGLLYTMDVFLSHLVPFLVELFAFFCLYYLVPKAPVHRRSAFFGACIAAIFFHISKVVYTDYISNFSSYKLIYDTTSAILIFLFWLYLLWSIVLFGAELSYQVQYLPRNAKLYTRSLLSVGDGLLLLAVQALLMIVKAYEKGDKMPNDLDLCEALGCSSIVLRPAIAALKRAQIISQGSEQGLPITLAKSPESILITDIIKALFLHTRQVICASELRELFRTLDQTSQSTLTLADLRIRGNS